MNTQKQLIRFNILFLLLLSLYSCNENDDNFIFKAVSKKIDKFNNLSEMVHFKESTSMFPNVWSAIQYNDGLDSQFSSGYGKTDRGYNTYEFS